MPLFDILQVWNRPSHHKLVYTFDGNISVTMYTISLNSIMQKNDSDQISKVFYLTIYLCDRLYRNNVYMVPSMELKQKPRKYQT